MTQRLLLLLVTSLSFSAFAVNLAPVKVPAKLRAKLKSFEPSAGVYLQQSGKFLVSSDDTTKKDDPWLFLMNDAGEIDATPVAVDGVKKMTDVESVSQGADGSIFIMGSQGLNKNGKDKPERNLFIQARFASEHSLVVEKSVTLRPLLLKAALTSGDSVLVQMRAQMEKQLDVESHFIKDDELYIGLKEPQPAAGQAVILKLGRVSDVFKGKVQASVWRVIDLRSGSGQTNYLSDLAWRGRELFATSTSATGVGHLWLVGEPMKRESDFQDAHPEGLIFKADGRGTLLFDQGSGDDGLFLHIN